LDNEWKNDELNKQNLIKFSREEEDLKIPILNKKSTKSKKPKNGKNDIYGRFKK
jgi:hypothetical protein